ncbi:hypothetical protein GUITHDRAFT_85102 [Guillardia theta CCMP2712]|uniref:Ras-related protein Rab-21 n=1 Tax=Guillardia theta (strain CCMP2712) TaxID=905079 RepID=L1JR90_GUITC|nr:hypothetical protein GUITHDRAFT_85102 [Guillardia theta CCMP2712]EKX51086.1 hypothetical protein GUITHDRAFT_85102 [Guillardia theta CCMP2712]|mmetsp:Transcript_10272/g.34241  ORF Transcript_10272/g.34241 Transcript_10272/m.34241 type:complete len:216 (-) Transcript_10272:1480-2127(-)|eukprot:XP_005838066.1 hypothetical protein GUITHDRAFT_85102 [Guillardia theta CCMP2712]
MADVRGKNNYKIVLLGEGRVGKTSLVLRYVNNTFSDKQQTTIQASFLSKRINIGENTCNLAIWDTAGQERFHALGPIYYRDADGALLVYDTTDTESFAKVKNWVKELRKMVGQEIVLCIAGNKIDLDKERQVEKSEAEEYAASVGAYHFQTSAKLGKGIEETFLALAKKMIEQRQENDSRQSARRSGGNAPILVVADDTSNGGSGAASGSKACNC